MSHLKFISKEPIEKGWSGDKKYCAVATDGTKYLLRITPDERSANRENMFRMQQQVASLDVSVCLPVEIGRCSEGIYTVHTWVYGKDAEEVMPHLTESKQYAYGVEAGKILKAIHSIPAPQDQPAWKLRFNTKIDRKIKNYNDCPIKFAGANLVIDYIESHRYLLDDRPLTFQHGDYHIGNMMIEGDKLVIIDFDRYDFGDPWEEFNRIVWSAQASPQFASGTIDGYFNDNVPLEFWKLLALYIGSNLLSSVPWAITYGQKEVDTMLGLAKDVLSWYNNMKSVVPAWYGG